MWKNSIRLWKPMIRNGLFLMKIKTKLRHSIDVALKTQQPPEFFTM